MEIFISFFLNGIAVVCLEFYIPQNRVKKINRFLQVCRVLPYLAERKESFD